MSPAFIDIELTSRCNLRCKSCWFHGESGIGDRYGDSEMATGEILGFLDHVAEHRPHIYFGGAEPFVRSDFLTIVAHARRRGLPTSFTTNGTLLDPAMTLQLVDLGVDLVNFSIDGPEKIHDALRGPGSFARATSSLRHLLESKKTRRASRPSIAVNVTVNPLVVGHLAETIRSIRDATGDNVDAYKIHHLWFIGPTELQAHQAAVKEALGRSAPGAGTHLVPFSQVFDPVVLADEISQMRGLARMKSFPNLERRQIIDFYSEGNRSTRRCRAPFRAVVVKPNGDVMFCPDEWIDDYVLGNIREDHIETIWSNERAGHFRSVLLRRGSFPGCKRCSWMYSF